jgi:hypothetical protein
MPGFNPIQSNPIQRRAASQSHEVNGTRTSAHRRGWAGAGLPPDHARAMPRESMQTCEAQTGFSSRNSGRLARRRGTHAAALGRLRQRQTAQGRVLSDLLIRRSKRGRRRRDGSDGRCCATEFRRLADHRNLPLRWVILLACCRQVIEEQRKGQEPSVGYTGLGEKLSHLNISCKSVLYNVSYAIPRPMPKNL